MGRAFEWVRETPDAGTMKKSDRIALWGVIVVLVVLVAIATLAMTGATTRRRWRVTFFVVGALAMTLVAVLTVT